MRPGWIGAMLAVSACAQPPSPAACPAGLTERAILTGYFGRTQGGTLRVTDAAWSGFVAAELLPRFPLGSTTTDATGTWRGARQPEPTKVVTLVVPPDAATTALAAMQAAADAYRRAFAQQSVGITLTQACAAGF